MKAGTISTDALNDLVAQYLQRLAQGECPPDDQGMAATILGEKIRLLENMVRAATQTATILARGIDQERAG